MTTSRKLRILAQSNPRNLASSLGVKILDRETGTGGHGHPEARQHGNEIWLFPKFYQQESDIQEFILYHEIGHYVLSTKSLKWLVKRAEELEIDVWNDLPFGQYNMDEAFADCFATYHTNQAELRSRYPKWFQLISEVVN